MPPSSPDANLRRRLLVRNMPGLRAYVRSLVRSSSLSADDVLQELSLKVLQGDAPEDPSAFFAWSCGVARHVVADARRERRSSPSITPEGDFPDPPDRKSDPETLADVSERLESAVRRLDGEELSLLMRRYLLEERAKDLADELSQKPGAVRLRLKRIRSSLSKRK